MTGTQTDSTGDTTMSLNLMSYPAATGEVVTEAHTTYCATNGHAVHTVDGVDSERCPRCGDLREEDATMTIDQQAAAHDDAMFGAQDSDLTGGPNYHHTYQRHAFSGRREILTATCEQCPDTFTGTMAECLNWCRAHEAAAAALVMAYWDARPWTWTSNTSRP